ncbi:MAG TPA: hypothetical protein VFM81_05650 [Actinomycetota bacterium]|nr:hypothetical protein [Actinomycetota bacterium]
MTDSKEAWAEVDRRFSEFGRIVAERHRKAGEEQGAPPPEQARRSLEEAFSAVTRQLDVAFATVGDTVRDPEAKDTLKLAGKAVMDALATTVNDVGEEIRKRRR